MSTSPTKTRNKTITQSGAIKPTINALGGAANSLAEIKKNKTNFKGMSSSQFGGQNKNQQKNGLSPDKKASLSSEVKITPIKSQRGGVNSPLKSQVVGQNKFKYGYVDQKDSILKIGQQSQPPGPIGKKDQQIHQRVQQQVPSHNKTPITQFKQVDDDSDIDRDKVSLLEKTKHNTPADNATISSNLERGSLEIVNKENFKSQIEIKNPMRIEDGEEIKNANSSDGEVLKQKNKDIIVDKKEKQEQLEAKRSYTPNLGSLIERPESAMSSVSSQKRLNRRPRSSRKSVGGDTSNAILTNFGDQKKEKKEIQVFQKLTKYQLPPVKDQSEPEVKQNLSRGKSSPAGLNTSKLKKPTQLNNSSITPYKPTPAENEKRENITPTMKEQANSDSLAYMDSLFNRISPPKVVKTEDSLLDSAKKSSSQYLEQLFRKISPPKARDIKETPEPADAPEPMRQGRAPVLTSPSRDNCTVGKFAAEQNTNENVPLRNQKQSSHDGSSREENSDSPPKTMMRLEGFMSGLGNRPAAQEREEEAIDFLPAESRPRRSSAIGEFLNQRINLSQTKIKNQWLKDLTPPPMSGLISPRSEGGGTTERSKEASTNQYSSINKERLERIENELREKKQRLSSGGQGVRLSGIKDSGFRLSLQQQAEEIGRQDALAVQTLAALGFSKVDSFNEANYLTNAKGSQEQEEGVRREDAQKEKPVAARPVIHEADIGVGLLKPVKIEPKDLKEVPRSSSILSARSTRSTGSQKSARSRVTGLSTYQAKPTVIKPYQKPATVSRSIAIPPLQTAQAKTPVKTNAIRKPGEGAKKNQNLLMNEGSKQTQEEAKKKEAEEKAIREVQAQAERAKEQARTNQEAQWTKAQAEAAAKAADKAAHDSQQLTSLLMLLRHNALSSGIPMLPSFFVKASDLLPQYPNLLQIISKNEYVLEKQEIAGEPCVRASGGHTIEAAKLVRKAISEDENIIEDHNTPSRHPLIVEDSEVVTGGQENRKTSADGMGVSDLSNGSPVATVVLGEGKELELEVSQRLFDKHADGIETIEESEPKLEQSQRIDIAKALLEGNEDTAVRAETEVEEPKRVAAIIGNQHKKPVSASKKNLSPGRFQTIQPPPRRNNLTTTSYQAKADRKIGVNAPARALQTPIKKPAAANLHQRNKTAVAGQSQQDSNEKASASRPGNARATSALSSSRSVFAGRPKESKPMLTNRYAKGSQNRDLRGVRSISELSNYQTAPVRPSTSLAPTAPPIEVASSVASETNVETPPTLLPVQETKPSDGELRKSSALAAQILSSLDEVEKSISQPEGQADTRPRLSLVDVQKRYENRGDFYKDFYKNVQSYKNFDAKSGYEDFMKRKSIAEERKKEALVKTDLLFQEAKMKQIAEMEQDQEEKRNSISKHRKTNTMFEPSDVTALVTTELTGTEDSDARQQYQRDVSPAPKSSPTKPLSGGIRKHPLGASSNYASQSKSSLPGKPGPARSAVPNRYMPPTIHKDTSQKSTLGRSNASSTSSSAQTSRPKPVNSAAKRQNPPTSSVGKMRPGAIPNMSRNANGLGRQPPQSRSKKPLAPKVEEPPQQTLAQKKALEAEELARIEKEQRLKEKLEKEKADRAAKREQSRKLRRRLQDSFVSVGIKLEDQLWEPIQESDDDENESDRSPLRKRAVYVSKDQLRNIFIHLGFLKDFNRKAPKLHQDITHTKSNTSQNSEPARLSPNDYIRSLRQNDPDMTEDIELKIQKLENYQFEDAFVMLATNNQRRHTIMTKPTSGPVSMKPGEKALDIVNIESVKSFVFALNGLVEDWMLIEKPAKKAKEVKPEPVLLPSIITPVVIPDVTHRLSVMEKRLLGKKGLKELEEGAKRKSIAEQQMLSNSLRQSQLEKEQILFQSKQDESSSEDSETSEYQKRVIRQEYFQLKRQEECKDLQQQFSHLKHNWKEKELSLKRAEEDEKNLERASSRQHTSRSNSSRISRSRRGQGVSRPSSSNELAGNEQNKITFGEEAESSQKIEGAASNEVVSPSFGQEESHEENVGTHAAIPDLRKESNRMSSKMENLINQPKALQGKESNYQTRNSSRQAEEETKTPVATKPTPKTLGVPKQEQSVGQHKKANTPSYLPKNTAQIQKQKAPYSSSKQLHQKPVRPYGGNVKTKPAPKQQNALLPSQIHTNTRNATDSLDKVDSISAHNPFNDNEQQKRSRAASQQSGDKKRQQQSQKEQQSPGAVSDRRSGLTAKLAQQALEPESLSSKMMEDGQEMQTINFDDNMKNVGSAEFQAMTMKLEPQSLSRGSKPKLLSDQSRKNLNETGISQTNANAAYGDQNLMNDINKMLYGQNSTGFLSDSLKILHSEGRLNTGTPPNAGVQNIQFNDNEEQLRAQFQKEIAHEEEKEETPDTEQKSILTSTPAEETPEGNHEIDQSAKKYQSPERPRNTQHNSDGKSSGRSEEPILILDIKLVRDKPEKITVYENDKPEDIVNKFCEEHSLDANKAARLLGVIHAQIKEYYQEIEEAMQMERSEGTSPRKRGLDEEFQEQPNYYEGSQPLTQIDENVNETDGSQEGD